LLLAHLSKDNNNPDLALQLFAEHARDTHVVVASRFAETEVYTIGAGDAIVMPQMQQSDHTMQISLF
jgi:hypothetical protein